MSDQRRTFRLEGPKGDAIESIPDWLKYAPPKRPDLHWKAGRSAMESARAWLPDGRTPTVPAEIAQLLASNPATQDFSPELAIPEFITRLDDHEGEHRNHDLVVTGAAAGGRTLLAIEAKADESFGSHTVRSYLEVCNTAAAAYPQKVAAALAAGNRRPRPSNAAARIKELCAALFGPPAEGEDAAEAAEPLRYQLITALAGALIEARARRCTQAVLIAHEFHSHPDPDRGLTGTSPQKVKRNAEAWSAFVETLTGEPAEKAPVFQGPVRAFGSHRVPAGIPAFLGKATRRLN